MAFQSRAASGGVPRGNVAMGQTATPPGDTVTSQLPAKVYSGNHKPFLPPSRSALILENSRHLGYFSTPSSYVGVRALPLNPTSRNADPSAIGGAQPGGGNSGQFPKRKTRKRPSAKSIIDQGVRKNRPSRSLESKAAYQLRTGRMSSRKTSKYRRSTAAGRIPRVISIARTNKRPYAPVTLGGGTLVRLSRK